MRLILIDSWYFLKTNCRNFATNFRGDGCRNFRVFFLQYLHESLNTFCFPDIESSIYFSAASFKPSNKNMRLWEASTMPCAYPKIIEVKEPSNLFWHRSNWMNLNYLTDTFANSVSYVYFIALHLFASQCNVLSK